MAKLTKKEYLRQYHLRKKTDPVYIAQRKAYYQEHKAYFKQKSHENYLRNKDRKKAKRNVERKKVIDHYGGRCACCGEKEIKFLAIDHINNDGHKQRKKMTLNINAWAIRHHYPKDLQVLCHNCNLAKAFYGICPHQEKQ